MLGQVAEGKDHDQIEQGGGRAEEQHQAQDGLVVAADGGFKWAFFLFDRSLFQGNERGCFIDFQADEDPDHHQYETEEKGDSPAKTFKLLAGQRGGQSHEHAVGQNLAKR
ncbi:hypothetical protein D3C76_1213520 [compost metagenome]